MGQQQLLLLVMGLLVVAVAVIAGMQAFEEGYKKSIIDRMMDRNLSIASHAVMWKTLKDPYDGGNTKYTGLETKGLARLSLDAQVGGASYAITAATDNTLEITGVSEKYPDIGVRTFVRGYDVDSTIVRYDGSLSLN